MLTNRISKMFAAVIAFAVVLATASFVSHSATIPAVDRSFDSIEQARTLRSFAHTISALGYDQIEAVRVERVAPSAAAYDLIEQVRSARGISADHSYDQIEAVRLAPTTTFSAEFGYDLVEQLRAGRGLTADRSYDLIETLRLQP